MAKRQGTCAGRSFYGGMSRQIREAVRTIEGKKQDTSETAVHIGQRDQHVISAGPDVQRIDFEDVLSVWPGGL